MEFYVYINRLQNKCWIYSKIKAWTFFKLVSYGDLCEQFLDFLLILHIR